MERKEFRHMYVALEVGFSGLSFEVDTNDGSGNDSNDPRDNLN